MSDEMSDEKISIQGTRKKNEWWNACSSPQKWLFQEISIQAYEKLENNTNSTKKIMFCLLAICKKEAHINSLSQQLLPLFVFFLHWHEKSGMLF
jgi:hypothetical protein